MCSCNVLFFHIRANPTSAAKCADVETDTRTTKCRSGQAGHLSDILSLRSTGVPERHNAAQANTNIFDRRGLAISCSIEAHLTADVMRKMRLTSQQIPQQHNNNIIQVSQFRETRADNVYGSSYSRISSILHPRV